MADYLADIRKYDALAEPETVDRIVKHLGVALHNPDSAVVSCSDPEELTRLRDKWCMNKLGERDAARCDFVIERICETMAGEETKSRVTFYFLAAKHLGKLETL